MMQLLFIHMQKVIKGKSLDGQMINEVNESSNDKLKFDIYKQRA